MFSVNLVVCPGLAVISFTLQLGCCGGVASQSDDGSRRVFSLLFLRIYGWIDDEGPSHASDSPIERCKGLSCLIKMTQGQISVHQYKELQFLQCYKFYQGLGWLEKSDVVDCMYFHIKPLHNRCAFWKKSYPVRDNNSDCDIKGGGFENYDGIEVTHCWMLQLPNTHLTLRKYGDAQQETKLRRCLCFLLGSRYGDCQLSVCLFHTLSLIRSL